ncbi:hypothetical protein PRIPAC_78450 [Pristionchus pacificus]|uniref:Uncharacterized protein n=1 Tax=Pristionchus pacificus TaxID=54126 RepID=A0A2A6BWQ7_PRIPA|nr:hypothetical protein PRIPAC_78450 [Pristionchus pacificus]|eukprot:PDM70432.1 hypothetical protein PRIPAC_46678 [Pristionchus pacificus]
MDGLLSRLYFHFVIASDFAKARVTTDIMEGRRDSLKLTSSLSIPPSSPVLNSLNSFCSFFFESCCSGVSLFILSTCRRSDAIVVLRREDRDGIEGEWGDLSRKSHRSMENGVLSGHIESKEGCCLRDSSHVVHGLDLTHEAMLWCEGWDREGSIYLETKRSEEIVIGLLSLSSLDYLSESERLRLIDHMLNRLETGKRRNLNLESISQQKERGTVQISSLDRYDHIGISGSSGEDVVRYSKVYSTVFNTNQEVESVCLTTCDHFPRRDRFDTSITSKFTRIELSSLRPIVTSDFRFHLKNN